MKFKLGLCLGAAAIVLGLAACGGGKFNPAITPVPAPGGGGSSGSSGGGSGNSNSLLTAAQPGDILVNQHGYSPDGQKLASLVSGAETSRTWELIDGGGVLASGMTQIYGENALSGQSFHKIDFSSYVLDASNAQIRVDGKTSHPFDITARPFQSLVTDSLKYYYQSRAGEAVKAAYVPAQSPALTRAAGHPKTAISCFNATDRWGTNWPSCGYTKTTEGGWYDAADYGQYVVNTGTALWTLQNIYERYEKQGSSCRADGAASNLNIPESGDDIHDLLDEARRGMEFLLSMQIDNGAPVALALGSQANDQALTLTQKSVKGMVHHKVHGDDFSALGTLPEDDRQTRYLYAPSTAATLHLAAVGAQCARIWKDIDADFSARCLGAAIKAYDAAIATPDAYAYDNFYGGGPYADTALSDEFTWAETELFITTGDTDYQAAAQGRLGSDGYSAHGRVNGGWAQTETFGMISLATQHYKDLSQPISLWQQQARDALFKISGHYMDQVAGTAFDLPNDDSKLYWGSNGNLAFRGLVLGTAHDLGASPDYKNAIQNILNYLMGRNPLGQSYISGYGEQAVENPHHHFWANGAEASYPKPPPGVMAGGPNNTAFIDTIARSIENECQGQTCYVDDREAYSMNEIAINWNAPLVWIADWVDNKALGCEG